MAAPVDVSGQTLGPAGAPLLTHGVEAGRTRIGPPPLPSAPRMALCSPPAVCRMQLMASLPSDTTDEDIPARGSALSRCLVQSLTCNEAVEVGQALAEETIAVASRAAGNGPPAVATGAAAACTSRTVRRPAMPAQHRCTPASPDTAAPWTATRTASPASDAAPGRHRPPQCW